MTFYEATRKSLQFHYSLYKLIILLNKNENSRARRP